MLACHKYQLLRILDSVKQEWPELIDQGLVEQILGMIPTDSEPDNREGYLSVVKFLYRMASGLSTTIA